MTTYQDFINSKAITATPRGLSNVPRLKSHLFPFQKHCVEFALRTGSSGLFLSTGLGKTACELEYATHAAEASNGKALILTPLAVARQIEKEGRRWDYPTRVIRNQDEAKEGINICNYDRVETLSPEEFGVIVLDESSIIKNFVGKTSRALINTLTKWKDGLIAIKDLSGGIIRAHEEAGWALQGVSDLDPANELHEFRERIFEIHENDPVLAFRTLAQNIIQTAEHIDHFNRLIQVFIVEQERTNPDRAWKLANLKLQANRRFHEEARRLA